MPLPLVIFTLLINLSGWALAGYYLSRYNAKDLELDRVHREFERYRSTYN